jgi:hypothetical protein
MTSAKEYPKALNGIEKKLYVVWRSRSEEDWAHGAASDYGPNGGV